MEGEEVHRQAGFSGAHHHVSPIWALAGGELPPIVINVISHPRAANHSIWIPILQSQDSCVDCQVVDVMPYSGSLAVSKAKDLIEALANGPLFGMDKQGATAR